MRWGAGVAGDQVAWAAESWQVCPAPRSQTGGMDFLWDVLTLQQISYVVAEVKDSTVFL